VPSADPQEVADAVLLRIPDEDLREVMRVVLRSYVRVRIGQQRIITRPAAPAMNEFDEAVADGLVEVSSSSGGTGKAPGQGKSWKVPQLLTDYRTGRPSTVANRLCQYYSAHSSS
jgi:hypothetical protein